MKPTKTFDEYVKDTTIRKVSIDKAKAEFLINESQNSLDRDYAEKVYIFLNKTYSRLKDILNNKLR